MTQTRITVLKSLEGFVWARCLLDKKIRQKRKDWWSKLLVSLNNFRKQTMLTWPGYVKQIPRCSEKSINITNCTRILQSGSDRRTDPRTFRHWKSRAFSEAVATSRSEYLTVKRITKKPICCSSCSSREDWSTDLCQKFLSSTSRAALSNEYDRTGGHNYYYYYYQIAKLVAEYCAEGFSSAVVPYVVLKEVPHGMVCLSESPRELNFHDVICARRYLRIRRL